MHLPSATPAQLVEDSLARAAAERAVWSAGDPEAVYAEFVPVAEAVAEWAGARPGHHVLAIDLPGTAAPVRARGAEVTVADWREVSADALGYPDASFDVVVSTFGHILAPDAGRAGAEIARVLRPGGTVAFASWHADGTMGRVFTTVRRYASHVPGAANPLAWGRAADIGRHMRPTFAGLEFQLGNIPHRGPSAERSWDFWRKAYGPVARGLETATGHRKEALTEELKAIIKMGFRSDIGLVWNREFILTRGTKA